MSDTAVSNDLIERAAIALCAQSVVRLTGAPNPGEWSTNQEYMRERYRQNARAVLAAIREPTDAMINAAGESGEYPTYESIWHAMIDEALRE